MGSESVAVEPLVSGHVDVGNGHRLYWETVGNPRGAPALYLHGGPGSGCTTRARQYFGPEFHGVLFDQRGCGRSQPLADSPSYDLTLNTTQHQIVDIEALREHLGIDRWIVMGVSWGVTLALAYAETYPDRVSAMVLGAVTAGTRREIEWITRDMGRVFPEEFTRFVDVLPPDARVGNLAAGYAALMASRDQQERARAARAWCRWEDTHVSLAPGWTPSSRYEDPTFAAVFTRLVTHYWSHACFLEEGQLMTGLPRIAGIPATLIHGRYDVSSPLDTAWHLHQPGQEVHCVSSATPATAAAPSPTRCATPWQRLTYDRADYNGSKAVGSTLPIDEVHRPCNALQPGRTAPSAADMRG